MQDFHTRKPRGFAFIEFIKEEDAAEAVRKMDRYELDGREIAIVLAKDRRKTPDEMRPRDRDRGGRDRGYGGGRDRSRSRDRGGRDRSPPRCGGGGGGRYEDDRRGGVSLLSPTIIIYYYYNQFYYDFVCY
jgi:RNA recognition motif-containing protein